MTAQEIKDLLKKDDDKFYSSKWEGELPNGFGDVFKLCFKFMPPTSFQGNLYKNIVPIKNKTEFSFSDIQLICNSIQIINPIDVMSNSSLFTDELYEDFIYEVQKTAIEWNQLNNKYHDSQDRKKKKYEEFLKK